MAYGSFIAERGDRLIVFWRSLAVLVLSNVILSIRGKSAELDLGVAVNVGIVLIFLVRFTLGNESYIRTTFASEPGEALAGPHDFRRVQMRYCLDGVLLALHLAAFLWMASTVFDPEPFRRAVMFLLCGDLWWLVYERNTRPRCLLLIWQLISEMRLRTGTQWSELTLTSNWLDQYAPRTWTWTNAATAAGLFCLDSAIRYWPIESTEAALLVLAITCSANTAIDVFRTHLTMDRSYTRA